MKRKHLRLECYDYSNGGTFFITVCTHNKKSVLSAIEKSEIGHPPVIRLTEIGKEVEKAIQYIKNLNNVILWSYVIMPNHIHMIISTENDADIIKIIHNFKSFTTHKYGTALCQRSYYDHIIRNEKDYIEKTNYIENNPVKWDEDEYYSI